MEIERRKSTRVRRQKLRHDHFFDSSSRSDFEMLEEVAVTEESPQNTNIALEEEVRECSG